MASELRPGYLTLVCSYCGLVYGTKPCDPGCEGESHGICRKCWPGAREDMGLDPAPYPGGEK